MERKQYQKPAVKTLDTRIDEMLFTPGGGVSESSPETPGVGGGGGAKEFDENLGNENFFKNYGRSVWDE